MDGANVHIIVLDTGCCWVDKKDKICTLILYQDAVILCSWVFFHQAGPLYEKAVYKMVEYLSR